MVVADLLELLEEAGRCRVIATFSLHRLDQHRPDVLGGDHMLEQQLELVEAVVDCLVLGLAPAVGVGEGDDEGGPEDRVVAVTVLGVAGGVGDGAHGAAVEGSPEGDDPLTPGVIAGQLDGRLHRFGAGVGETELVDAVGGDLGQALGGMDDRLVVDDAAGVDQAVDLGVGGGHHGRMAMAQVGDGGAAGEVGPAVAVLVGDPQPLGLVGDDGSVEGDDGGDDVGVSGEVLAHGAP